ncbi:MAG: hypothetical protein IPN23_04130 [Elusimicrobia bacterium]|nr:hypothetical protein [Elusimicrobiota bacterium]
MSILLTAQGVLTHAAEGAFWRDRRSARAVLMNSPAVATGSSAWAEERPHPSVQTARVVLNHSVLVSPQTQDILADLAGPHATVSDIRVARRPGAPWVIHIQDIHGNRSAQMHIARLLDRLSGAGLTWVGVEGAEGPFDLGGFRDWPDRSLTRAIADSFLHEGFLTGVEHAAITLSPPIRLWGVERDALYQANVDALLRVDGPVRRLRGQINSWKSALEAHKPRVYGPALSRWDRARRACQGGDMGYGAYARVLAGLLNEDFKDLPHMAALARAAVMESRLDPGAARAEAERMAQSLGRALDRASMLRWARLAAEHRAGRLNGKVFREMTAPLMAAAGLSWREFPSLSTGFEYNGLAESLDRRALLREMARAEERVRTRLPRTEGERRLARIDHDVDLAERMVCHRLRLEDWEQYLARRLMIGRWETANFSGAGWREEDLEEVEQFYRLALERNDEFVKNIRGMAPSISVLVAGGFHTDGLTRLWRDQGVSYVVLTPHAVVDGVNEDPARSLFSRDPLPLDRLFTADRISLAPRPLLSPSPFVEKHRSLLRTLYSMIQIWMARRSAIDEAPGGDAAWEDVHWEEPALHMTRGGVEYQLEPAGKQEKASLELQIRNQRLAFSVVSHAAATATGRWGPGAKITLFASLAFLSMPAWAATTPLGGWMMWPALIFAWPMRIVLPWVENVWRTWTRADVIVGDPGGFRVTSGPAVLWTESALAGRVGNPFRLMAFTVGDVDWNRWWSHLDDIRALLEGVAGSPKIQSLLTGLNEFSREPLFPQRAGKRLVVRALNRLVADRNLWQRLPIEFERLNMEARDILERVREVGAGGVPSRAMFALNRRLLLEFFGPALIPGRIHIVLFDGLLHSEHFRQLHRIHPFAEAFVSSEGSPNQHSILGMLSRWPRLMAVTGAGDLHALWAHRRGEVRSAIVDESGLVVVNPTPDQDRWARRLGLDRDTMNAAAGLTEFKSRGAASSPVDIYLNAASPEAIREGVAGGAVGVGLVRFEDVWGVRTPLTDYALVLTQDEMVPGMIRPLEPLVKAALDADLPIHVRMLDAQDDKLDGLLDDIEERGLDFLLHHPIGQRLAVAQLIALAELKNRFPATRLSVLFPEVKSVRDVEEIFELIMQGMVVRPGLAGALKRIPVRLMVESPVPDEEFVRMISMEGVSGISFGSNSWLEAYYGVKRGTPESREHETQLNLPLLFDLQRYMDLVSRVNSDRSPETELSVHVCGNFAARDDALGLWTGLARRYPNVPLRLSVPPKQARRIGFILRHVPEDFSMNLLDDLLTKARTYKSIADRSAETGADVNTLGGQRYDQFRLNALHHFAQRRVEGFLNWITLLIRTSPDFQRLKDTIENGQPPSRSQNGADGRWLPAFIPVGVGMGEGAGIWEKTAPLWSVPDAMLWGMGLLFAVGLAAVYGIQRGAGSKGFC